MTSIKDIISKYEVTRATLHNWKTTKPNLYNLLLNPEDTNEKLRDINIVLEKYSKTIKNTFSEDDILFILNLSLENFVNEIEKLHTIYIEQTAKELKENSEFVLAVYQKIKDLNLIERYIFISRIKSLRKEKIKQTDIKTAIKHYFKEFLIYFYIKLLYYKNKKIAHLLAKLEFLFYLLYFDLNSLHLQHQTKVQYKQMVQDLVLTKLLNMENL